MGPVVTIPLDEVKSGSGAEANCSQNHKEEISGRTREGHYGGAMWMPLRPVRIIRRTGKPDHAPVEKKEAKQREHYHAIRRPANVRDGVQGNLTAEIRSIVAAKLGNKRVGSFMTRGGEKENSVVDEAKRQELGSEIWHK